ncbi:hypothetical protein GCM10010112_25170 [Actinoplanes lobatus]|uniref:Uncharacterized protein n=1 Tax=Actinoplanes lobatus TaxID=113568 RepID=A0A7W7MJ09_9ACTN|nr:hypothetical protein [Actinoplanes lobatus]MBB4751560.1 hypothetical protein [Actinoplanes lobatus]GGN64675.1 hypothetical protein GCM10010112_25170 [Actinoplanes lobatus]GIE45935.1 hypothetical protein Alo02nite_88330 [Actinoplanes lobatus]
MTRDIEELIRAAQELRADQAPPAERVRAALPRRTAQVKKQRRYGLGGAIVAAAAVTAAIAVPSLAVRDDTGAAATVQPAAPSTAPATASASPGVPAQEPVATEVDLGFKPTWVPPGFAEHIRTASAADPGNGFGPVLRRVWKKNVGIGDPWTGAELSLSVFSGMTGADVDRSGQPIDVNGAQGYYSPAQNDRKSSVIWHPAQNTVLMLTASKLDISKNDLLRMARSVRPDTGVTGVPARLNWLPDGWITTGTTVSGPSPSQWRAEFSTVKNQLVTYSEKLKKEMKEGVVQPVGQLSVVVGLTTDAPSGGTELTVGGRPARIPVRTDEAGRDLLYLVVDLGGNRLLTLVGNGAGLTVDDLRRIAEQTLVEPAGLEWLGR